MRLHTFKRKREDVERPWTPVQLLLVGELGERSTTQRLVFRRFCESLADTFASESLYFVVLHEGFDVGSAIVHKSRVQRHDDDDLFSMPWKAKFDVLDENLAGARVYLFPDTLPMPLYRYVLGVQMQFPLQWSASINDQMTYYELCARTREYTSATTTCGVSLPADDDDCTHSMSLDDFNRKYNGGRCLDKVIGLDHFRDADIASDTDVPARCVAWQLHFCKNGVGDRNVRATQLLYAGNPSYRSVRGNMPVCGDAFVTATFTSFERMNSGTVRLVCLACPTRGNIVPVNELLKGDWREANSWFTSWRCERHRPCLP